MEIVPIKYAESVLSENQIFMGGDKNKYRPIVFVLYLIKTANRTILVDAGCDTMPGFDMKNFIGPVKALAIVNVSPEDISDVIITHAHHDHIDAVRHFNRALIHIQRDEFQAGKTYIPDGFRVNLFDDEFLLCPGVRVIKIGGHTAGSCIVEITSNNKTYIISGDECYLKECLTNKVVTGSSACPEKSKAFIEKYSASKYTVLMCHDT